MANVNDNALSSASQCAMIKAYMEDGNSITQLDALNLFGCMRLASRICDLRDKGCNIKMEKIKTRTGKFVASYSIVKDKAS